jgi:predicted transcriptional regulator
MHTVNLDTILSASPETEAEQARRFAWEAEGIARARTSVAAGYYATSTEVSAWIESLWTDNPLPPPYPNLQRHRRTL